MNKTTKTILLVLIVIIAIAGVWYGVNKKLTSVNKETIKIGATLPLTGQLAYKGEKARKGIELAVKKINSQGGINGKSLEVIIEDNQGDSAKAVTDVQKLLDIDKVTIILSNFTHISSAIAPLVNKKGILIYQSTVNSIASKNEYVCKDYYSMENAGELLGEMACRETNMSKVGILYPVSEWGEDFKNGFEKQLKNCGKEFVSLSFNSNENDFKTLVAKLKSYGVDTVGATGLVQHELEIIRNLSKLNWNVKPFMIELKQSAIISDTLAKDYLDKNGAVTIWYWFDPEVENLTKKSKDFVVSYTQLYNETPTADAVYFYDEVMYVSEILKKVKDYKNRDEIIRKIKENYFEGVGGSLHFDDKCINERPLHVLEFLSGKWVVKR